ncbi:MAG: hypothetical protein IPO04_04450 [Cytophagaceae bacterium]|nr:hypothetical protein [Cytophagaceae bacterium]
MPEPEISFSYTIGENGDVVFINESKNVKEYLWDFGDGESSSQVSQSIISLLIKPILLP